MDLDNETSIMIKSESFNKHAIVTKCEMFKMLIRLIFLATIITLSVISLFGFIIYLVYAIVTGNWKHLKPHNGYITWNL